MSATSISSGKNGSFPAADWLALLQQAANEVFSMMVGVDLKVAGLAAVEPATGTPEITGAVGIAGAISAIFSLRCRLGCATQIASRMLGVDPEQALAQHCDAIGEICNMVAGQFKAKIGLEAECMLSLPTVISGRNYQVHGPSASCRLEVPVIFEEEQMWLLLEVRL